MINWSLIGSVLSFLGPLGALAGALWYLSARLTRQDTKLEYIDSTLKRHSDLMVTVPERLARLEGRSEAMAEMAEDPTRPVTKNRPRH